MQEHWIQIALAIIALFAGVSIYFKVVSKKKSNKVSQKDNIVGGDQAGRDINKRQ